MAGCEGTLQNLIAGLSEAEDLKVERDAAEETMNDNLSSLRSAAGFMAASCSIAVITRSPFSAIGCELHAARTELALLNYEASLADFALKNHVFNQKVAENHELFNRFCYCLSLGVEAIEYGNEFEALEEQLEELLDEVDDATDPDDVDALEEEIEEVLEDLEHFDELLDEIREEIEREFGP